MTPTAAVPVCIVLLVIVGQLALLLGGQDAHNLLLNRRIGHVAALGNLEQLATLLGGQAQAVSRWTGLRTSAQGHQSHNSQAKGGLEQVCELHHLVWLVPFVGATHPFALLKVTNEPEPCGLHF